MQWFKKWWQERNGSPSNDESFRGGNKCTKGTTNQQTFDDTKSQKTLSRESICESSDKSARASSSESCSSSTSHASVQTNVSPSSPRSIQSSPIACRLRQQAKDLESLISGSVSSNHSFNVDRGDGDIEVLDPDEFFEDPEEIRSYKEKNAYLDEYIIIDIKEVEAVTQHISSYSINNKKPKSVKYATTEFTKNTDKKNKLKSQTQVFSMMSCCDDGYGLFYGTPSLSLSQIPQSFYYRTFNENIVYGSTYSKSSKRHKSPREGIPSSSRKLSTSAETLDEKVNAFEKSLMGPLINELPKPCAKSTEQFSIPKTFGLTDEGDILVNVDHIIEEKGRGFFLTKYLSIYRSIELGDAICEKRRIGRSILAILKEFFHQLCKFHENN